MAVTWKKFAYFTDIPTFASAAEIITGAEAAKAIAPDQLKAAGIVPGGGGAGDFLVTQVFS